MFFGCLEAEAEAAAIAAVEAEAEAAAALVELIQGIQSEAAAAEAGAAAREAEAAAAKDEVEYEVEQENEYVEVDGCVIIPDESANSAPRPPPVVFNPLLDALHTLQLRMDEVIEGHSDAWAGRQKRRCRQWFELVHPDHGGSDKGFVAVKAANEVVQQNINAWREVYLLWICPQLYRDRQECFRCLGDEDKQHSGGLGKGTNYFMKPGAKEEQLRDQYLKERAHRRNEQHVEGSAKMTAINVKELAAYRQKVEEQQNKPMEDQ